MTTQLVLLLSLTESGHRRERPSWRTRPEKRGLVRDDLSLWSLPVPTRVFRVRKWTTAEPVQVEREKSFWTHPGLFRPQRPPDVTPSFVSEGDPFPLFPLRRLLFLLRSSSPGPSGLGVPRLLRLTVLREGNRSFCLCPVGRNAPDAPVVYWGVTAYDIDVRTDSTGPYDIHVCSKRYHFHVYVNND